MIFNNRRESGLEMDANNTAKKRSVVKTYAKLFIISAKASPIWCGLALLCDLCNGVISGSFVVFTQAFFNQASISTDFNWTLIRTLGTLAGVLLIQHVINGMGHTILPYFRNKVNKVAISRLNQKAGELPPILFENSEFLNQIEKAYQGSNFSRSVVVPFLRFVFYIYPI